MPYSQAYVAPPGLDGNTDIIAACSSLNAGDQCAIDTCIVEAQFLVDFELVGAVSLTIKHLHALNFDVDSNCVKVVNPNNGPRDSCCGEYGAFNLIMMGEMRKKCYFLKINHNFSNEIFDAL